MLSFEKTDFEILTKNLIHRFRVVPTRRSPFPKGEGEPLAGRQYAKVLFVDITATQASCASKASKPSPVGEKKSPFGRLLSGDHCEAQWWMRFSLLKRHPAPLLHQLVNILTDPRKVHPNTPIGNSDHKYSQGLQILRSYPILLYALRL